MQSLSGLDELEDAAAAATPLSRSRYGSRWELCSTWAAAAPGAPGGGQCFLLWQNHNSTVPKMNTIPAGMPMMTGQGRALEVGENTGVMGGFVSGKEEVRRRKIKKIKTGFEASVSASRALGTPRHLAAR